jgi:hypothetical protein
MNALGGLPVLGNARAIAENSSRRCAPMAACSACAGDYEDPERTAWRGASEGEQDDDDPNSEAPSDRLGASREIGATRVESEDEFPAQ